MSEKVSSKVLISTFEENEVFFSILVNTKLFSDNIKSCQGNRCRKGGVITCNCSHNFLWES